MMQGGIFFFGVMMKLTYCMSKKSFHTSKYTSNLLDVPDHNLVTHDFFGKFGKFLLECLEWKYGRFLNFLITSFKSLVMLEKVLN